MIYGPSDFKKWLADLRRDCLHHGSELKLTIPQLKQCYFNLGLNRHKVYGINCDVNNGFTFMESLVGHQHLRKGRS
jgi:hypothetical protein